MRVQVNGSEAEGITALAQNSDPFTYFAERPIRVCEGIEIDDGTLALGVLKRATQRDTPTLIARLFSDTRPAAQHRQIESFDDVTEAIVTSISEDKQGELRPFPIQVDGDYIGEKTQVELRAAPGALTVVA
jgi:diacylglycerol kinase family enzyme